MNMKKHVQQKQNWQLASLRTEGAVREAILFNTSLYWQTFAIVLDRHTAFLLIDRYLKRHELYPANVVRGYTILTWIIEGDYGTT